MEKDNRPMPLKVKEAVDFIYEMLAGRTEGYYFSAEALGLYVRLCVTALIKRGIVKKELFSNGVKSGKRYAYTWVAAMAPTKTLYANITDDIRAKRRDWNKKRCNKKNAETPAIQCEPSAEKEQAVVVTPLVATQNTLDGFSAQELWDELKRRGYSIENDRLVIIKKAYLD